MDPRAAPSPASHSRPLDLAFTAYKRVLSPVLHALAPGSGGCCYQPSCSEYATLALAQHGVARGGAMAVWRLLRCNPFSRGGWDPVPAARRRRSTM